MDVAFSTLLLQIAPKSVILVFKRLVLSLVSPSALGKPENVWEKENSLTYLSVMVWFGRFPKMLWLLQKIVSNDEDTKQNRADLIFQPAFCLWYCSQPSNQLSPHHRLTLSVFFSKVDSSKAFPFSHACVRFSQAWLGVLAFFVKESSLRDPSTIETHF